MIQETCERCNQPFEIDDSKCEDELSRRVLGMQRTCSPCLDAIQQELRDGEKRSELRKQEDRWLSICPKRYLDTDPRHAGLEESFVAAAEAWDAIGDVGLGLTGESRRGKTRLLFRCLRRAFDAGKSVEFLNHCDFSELVLDAFAPRDGETNEKARKRLLRLRSVGVLLLDDLGKAAPSERCDEQLENLIEKRGGACLPILWSANGSSAWLASRVGPDRGVPLVKRLAEFCHVVNA